MSGFNDVIAENFNKIKSDFEKKSYTQFEDFDEDLFMDTYLRCADALKGKEMTKNEYIKYYWAAYANRFKTDRADAMKFVRLDDPNREQAISLYSHYNINVDITCEEIIKNVKLKFGDYYANAWLLHVSEDKTYKELESLGYNFKFNDVFKKITKWVRSEFKRARFAR
jgi:hypothetical protein